MRFGLSLYASFTVYLLCLLIFFIMLIYRREIGLYFIVALLPLQNLLEKLHPFPLGKDIVDIFLLTLLFLCFFRPEENHRDEKDFQFLNSIRPILFYVSLTYIYLWIGSINIGIDLPFGLDNERFMNWKNHMILPLLFFITLKIIKEKRQIILLTSSMLISIFLVSFHFYRNFDHTSGHFRWDRREAGTFTYLGPNDIGAFWAEYSFIILGILFLCKLRFWRWPLLVLLGFNLYCLVYTFSRGAYLAFIGAFLFITLARKNLKALAIILVFLIFWTAFVPQSVVERIEMTETEEGFEGSTRGRIGRWEHGINLFIKNPIGYGFDTVKYLGFRGHTGHLSTRGDPHNRYIEYLVEMGIPGIVIFLYLFYLAFKSGWNLYINANDEFSRGLGLGFTATVIACMIANFFGDRWTYVMISGFYWVFWALVVRGNIIIQKEKQMTMQNPALG